MKHNSEILMKALFLESKYFNLLKEIVNQKKLFASPLDFWTTWHKVATYQTTAQRIALNNIKK